jgi:hypothetical protein
VIKAYEPMPTFFDLVVHQHKTSGSFEEKDIFSKKVILKSRCDLSVKETDLSTI